MGAWERLREWSAFSVIITGLSVHPESGRVLSVSIVGSQQKKRECTEASSGVSAPTVVNNVNILKD